MIATVNHTYARQGTRPMSQPNLRRSRGAAAVLRRRGGEPRPARSSSRSSRLDGTASLYGPAPQSLLDEDQGGRLFTPLLEAAPALDIEDRMRREIRFDPDLWWIEIEDRAGRHFWNWRGMRSLGLGGFPASCLRRSPERRRVRQLRRRLGDMPTLAGQIFGDGAPQRRIGDVVGASRSSTGR